MATTTELPSSCEILDLGRATIGVSYDPGYPGNLTGHPDTWEPAEPRGIESLYVLLRSRNVWARVMPETCPELEADLWQHIETAES